MTICACLIHVSLDMFRQRTFIPVCKDMNRLENKQQVFTIAQTAELLGCHPATVYRRIYAGEFKVLNSPGRIRIPRSQLESHLSDTVTYVPRSRKCARSAGRDVAR